MSISARFQLTKGAFFLDVELRISSSGVTSIMGPSGCGKTTILRLIAGLDRADYGYFKTGDDVWQDEKLFLPAHQRRLGYVFQEASLFDHLNVQENVSYGLKRVPATERKILLDSAIELTGISHLLSRDSTNLSGGERQRVAIARALATSPRMLLMDEPLASLDPQSRSKLLPMLESLHAELNIPVIYVSHSPDEVARLADHLILMESGRVIASGPIAEILTRSDLPLAHSEDAEALIEAVVSEHDEEYQLSYLIFAGGQFSVPMKALETGQKVRLRVLAKDVSLTLAHQSDTSILNIFPVIIDEITPLGKTQLTVRILAGGVPLLSRITRKSADLLDLKVGMSLFAQAKSVALLA